MATYVDPKLTHPTKHRLVSAGLESITESVGGEITSDNISDATTIGKEILTAEGAQSVRTMIAAAPDTAATTSEFGLMSPSDKTKLDGVQAGATVGASWGTNLSGIPTALTSPQAAGTASIRSLGTGATQAAAGDHNHAIVADEDSGLGAASTLQEAFIALSARIKALEDATP